MRRLRVALLAVLAAGCGSFPSLPPCESNADCDPSQHCVAEQCVGGAPDAAEPDATAPPADATPNDAAPQPMDSTSDSAVPPPDGPDPDAQDPDARRPDAERPDGRTADAARPDGATPDTSVPDATDPDALIPDAADPDAAIPDAALPDAAAPDAAIPDAALPDAAAPDMHVCVPVQETCDGEDNDCDGEVDEVDDRAPDCVPDNPDECGGRWVCAENGPICVARHDRFEVERCNEEDDDCDGEVDESYDLTRDINNCGACGHACEPLPNGHGLCALSRCFVSRCEDGWYDVEPGDEGRAAGCETRIAGRTLFVRIDGDDDAPGTFELPLATLAEANRRAAAAIPPDLVTVIDVGPDEFEGEIELGVDYLTVRGAGRDRTRINGRVTIDGDYTRVQDLTVDAGGRAEGIHLTCRRGCAVVDTVVQNVGPTPHEAPFVDAPVAAIRVTSGEDHLLHGNHILEVHGSTPPVPGLGNEILCRWSHGSVATGILLEAGAQGSRISGNNIDTVTGGTGSTPTPEVCNGGSLGGMGGPAYGILLSDRAGNYKLIGNRIERITGGSGGNGQPGVVLDPAPPDANDGDVLRSPDGTGGTGGLAAAIRIEGAGHLLRDNIMSTIRGGRGGLAGGPRGYDGPDAQGFGLYFHPFIPAGAGAPADPDATLTAAEPALHVDVDASNLYENEPLYFCYRQRVDWVGRRLVGNKSPTNLGRMVLVDCDRSTVLRNNLGGFTGATGRASALGSVTVPGGEGAGITLIGTSEARIEDNEIAGVVGGRGSQGAFDTNVIGLLTTGGRGGAAAGIRLRDSTDNILIRNVIRAVTGGRGGPGGLSNGNGGPGGRAAGIELGRGSTGNLLDENEINALAGGVGGTTGHFIDIDEPDAPPGRAVGLYFADEAIALASDVRPTNTYEGLGYAHILDQPGMPLGGLTMRTCKAMSNLGQVILARSPGASLGPLEIVCEPAEGEVPEVMGEPGSPATSTALGEAGGDFAAIRVLDSADVLLSDVRVAGIWGGPGGATRVGSMGGSGGLAFGLDVRRSPRLTLESARVHEIHAGEPAPAFDDLRIFRATGLRGDIALGLGIYLEDSPGVTIRNTLVDHMESEGWSIAFLFQDAGLGNVVREVTVADVVGRNFGYEPFDFQHPNLSGAIVVQGAEAATVDATNLIVAEVSGTPLRAAGFGNQINQFQACFRGDRQTFKSGGGTFDGFYAENPVPFFDEDAELLYALDPLSPCADPANGLCIAEPGMPEGFCQTVLGYLGGTPEGVVQRP